MKSNFASAGKTDPANSTFKHIFLMRNPNGREIDIVGYSKPLLAKEATDKIAALQNELYRLITNQGYIFGLHKKYQSKTLQTEIFLNGTYTGLPDEKIVTLYPDEYVFETNSEYVTDPRLNSFLKKLYTQAKEGKFVKSALMSKPKFSKADELFDLSKKRFATEPELYDWMQKRIREGHAHGEVKNFYFKYREKYF